MTARQRQSKKQGTDRRRGVAGSEARRVAAEALLRIERDGAYANLALPKILERADGLNDRDRRFVTELVYGTIRMRRACDWLVDRYITTEPDAETRALLRLGAYQLVYTHTPAYAVLNATVAVAPPSTRGFVNAVLRKLLKPGGTGPGTLAEPTWPSDAIRLSYPDWLYERLCTDLGRERAVAALEMMNQRPVVSTRADGYVQDLSSQWVAAAVGASEGELVLDLCSAPGGKATYLAERGAVVVAGDLHPNRAGLVVRNAAKVGVAERVHALVLDAARAPFPDRSAGRVLLDAPCTGIGALRRRPDARWRISAADVDALAELQRRLLVEGLRVLRPGGTLVYSACTMTASETVDHDRWLDAESRDIQVLTDPPPSGPWSALGRGWMLMPQDDADGMYLLRLQKRSA